ncbi:MAG: acetolactate decarboxylase [Candidatus Ancaeobacter aquaticus]|nr:acetolactate decarboxylase [Candidatus Ancaeobacter aquaticus]
MIKNMRCSLMLCLASALVLCGCVNQKKYIANEGEIFQVSTIGALLKGDYDGDITIHALKAHGDVGIGTFNGLDGELVMVDGECYQVKHSGKVVIADNLAKTPFAVVTGFTSDALHKIDERKTIDEMKTYIDKLLPTKNIFYAIRIDGMFEYIRTRSVARQEKPYQKLTDALKDQSVFEFNDIEGTIIGFRCPPYINNLNVPGYHFHFISKDRRHGGHLLASTTKNVYVQIDADDTFFMVLPRTEPFYKMHFDSQKSEYR